MSELGSISTHSLSYFLNVGLAAKLGDGPISPTLYR